MPDPSFAATDDEAAARYHRFGSVDPFPDIESALLNSADIADYVAATGMIFPFTYNADRLKAATYEVAALGPYTYWDEQLDRVEDSLGDGDEFTLPPNTIAFVTLEPKFRVPTYLALRFNLHISYIHRGLLLGTGPLVDPGFEGHLAVPLHNLTLNPYTIRGGDGLIWLEVTKLSRHRTRIKSTLEHGLDRADRKVFAFDPKKRNLTLRQYLYRAWSGRPIASSIATTVEEAGRAAEDARDRADDARRTADNYRNVGFIAGAIALAAVFIGLASVAVATWLLVHDVDTRLADETRSVVQMRSNAATTADEILQLQKQICALQAKTPSPPPLSCPTPVASPRP
jgi:deoxycytidine triphosphate deaminase